MVELWWDLSNENFVQDASQEFRVADGLIFSPGEGDEFFSVPDKPDAEADPVVA